MSEAQKTPSETMFADFIQWMNEGRRLASLFDSKGMTVPDELNKAIAVGPTNAPRIIIRPPEQPLRPPTAKDDWIWVKASEVFARTLVLAILHDGQGWTVKDLFKRVRKFLPDTSEGTIYNIGSSLDGKMISRTDEGWKLIGPNAPVLTDNYVWGPASVFQKQDLASHRRAAALHLLSMHPDGLKLMQILKMLKGVSWLQAPINKELLKDDFKVLERDDHVRRHSSSLKWTVFDSKGERMKKI